jgi:ficolin
MRTYNPQDSKAVDELDPCIAAEIRAKNERLFKKSHRFTIIIIAILITLICAAAILLLVYFFVYSSKDTKASDYDSGALKESGYLNHPKNQAKFDSDVANYEELLVPGKAMGDKTVDSKVALTPPSNDGSVVPMNTNLPPGTMTVLDAPINTDITTVKPAVVTERRPEPTKGIEAVTYSTKSDETPDIVPSFSSINNDKYGPIETDDIYEDCEQYRKNNHDQSGVYNINLDGNTFRALCLMEPDYAWMVLQRRTNNHLSFNRSFDEYADGFGSPSGDHWLGLEKVYQYVKKGHKLQLRIELRGDHCDDCSKLGADGYWWGDWDFAVGSKADKYKLKISPILHGNLTDPADDEFFKLNNGRPFTTYDQDNDHKPRFNCANFRNYGAWWHHDCTFTALNGAYGAQTKATSSMVWLYKQRKSGPNNALDSYSIKPQMSLMMFRIVKV